MRFAQEILREEWQDFEKRHRGAISRRTTRRTGTLETRRSYRVLNQGSKGGPEAQLTHPIYERFIDMRRYYYGDVKTRGGTRQNVLTRKKGRPIHNRIIFGKLNPLSFRLLNELALRVQDFIKANNPLPRR